MKYFILFAITEIVSFPISIATFVKETTSFTTITQIINTNSLKKWSQTDKE